MAKLNQTELYNLALSDLDTFAYLCMGTDASKAFPPTYKTIWQVWQQAALAPKGSDEAFQDMAYGIPRGFVKTTLGKLFVVWCIVYTQKSFPLIVQASESMAESFISDCADMLDNENFLAVFGSWRKEITVENKVLKVFRFNGRNIILRAIGVGTAARGIVRKNKRPDLIILDDIQTREDADSEISYQKLRNWLGGTLEYLRSPEGTLKIFLGNMYPTKYCILRDLRDSPAWKSLIVGAILSNGESLWEELHPIRRLLVDYSKAKANNQTHIFLSEILNDEDATGITRFDIGSVNSFDISSDIPTGCFIVIDPSGYKETSDYCEIVYCEVYSSIPVLVKRIGGRFTPLETIEHAFELASRYGCTRIYVESVAYQSSLIYWFNQTLEAIGDRSITVAELFPGGRSKNARIMEALNLWQSNKIGVASDCLPLVLQEAKQFNPKLKKNIDNLLDILAYAGQIYLKDGQTLPVPLSLYSNMQTQKSKVLLRTNIC